MGFYRWSKRTSLSTLVLLRLSSLYKDERVPDCPVVSSKLGLFVNEELLALCSWESANDWRLFRRFRPPFCLLLRLYVGWYELLPTEGELKGAWSLILVVFNWWWKSQCQVAMHFVSAEYEILSPWRSLGLTLRLRWDLKAQLDVRMVREK